MSIDFNTIRTAHNLIEVASRYCELQKSGSEYKCLCPFHDDSNPSCTYYHCNDGFWRYRCFSCGAGNEGGDVVDFVAAINNVSTLEAAQILTGGSLPEVGSFIPAPAAPSEEKCWDPIIPVPPDAPDYEPEHTYNPKAGAVKNYSYKLKRQDPYYDSDGNLICYVVRLEYEDGAKITPTITYCEGPDGERRWCAQRMKPPFPLMGLDELAARPTAHVLIVSGEKCKISASARLPKFVVVSTMGGDNAIGRMDLTPLIGRKVVLLPDHDKSGVASMHALGAAIT